MEEKKKKYSYKGRYFLSYDIFIKNIYLQINFPPQTSALLFIITDLHHTLCLHGSMARDRIFIIYTDFIYILTAVINNMKSIQALHQVSFAEASLLLLTRFYLPKISVIFNFHI